MKPDILAIMWHNDLHKIVERRLSGLPVVQNTVRAMLTGRDLHRFDRTFGTGEGSRLSQEPREGRHDRDPDVWRQWQAMGRIRPDPVLETYKVLYDEEN